MIIKTISDKCNMTHKHYNKQPTQMSERRVNFGIDRCSHFLNALDRNKNDRLIRKYSHLRANIK